MRNKNCVASSVAHKLFPLFPTHALWSRWVEEIIILKKKTTIKAKRGKNREREKSAEINLEESDNHHHSSSSSAPLSSPAVSDP